MVLYAFFAFYVGIALVCLLFGWRGARSDHRARGGFYLCVLFFVPLLASVHVLRGGAVARLERAGIVPHPALAGPSGLAVGLDHSPRTWVFDVAGSGDAALAFYRDGAHVSGWRLSADAPGMLEFRRAGQRLVISGGDRPSLVYMIYDEPRPDGQ